MSEANFDVVFIGGGPGGYIGAIRAAGEIEGEVGAECFETRGMIG